MVYAPLDLPSGMIAVHLGKSSADGTLATTVVVVRMPQIDQLYVSAVTGEHLPDSDSGRYTATSHAEDLSLK